MSPISYGSILVLLVLMLLLPSVMWAFTRGLDKITGFVRLASKKFVNSITDQ